MIDQAIVLVGGRGTRLKSVVSDIPKPMAAILDRPFLYYLLSKLKREGIRKTVLAVGYKHEVIQDYFHQEFQGMEIIYSIEEEPLGTGGAVKQAFQLLDGPAFVFNGDAFFNIPFHDLYQTYNQSQSDIVIALKRDRAFDRYGHVSVDASGRITEFQEKGYVDEGTFNGGVYIIHPQIWNKIDVGLKFSFETDVMEAYVSTENFSARAFDDYFIDIGIPRDYEQAQVDFSFFNIDSLWTIFLDRDGVINRLKPNDYVKSIAEFEFIEGSKQATAALSQCFQHVVVVTNQQGIGKGIMTDRDVQEVHHYLNIAVNEVDGKISKIYYCPELEEQHPMCRKPNVGMALQAQNDFPEIDFSKSIMIGDSDSDMQFGSNLGMLLIRIDKDHTNRSIKSCASLQEASAFLMQWFNKTQ